MSGGVQLTGLDQISSRTQLGRSPLRRPKTVPIVASFLFLASGIASVVGIGLLFPGPLLDSLWKLNPEGAVFFHSIGRISGLFLLALGVATFAAGRGMLHAQRWAWWFAVGLFSIDACGDIVSYFLIRDPLRTVSGAVISSTFLYFVCRAGMRNYFIRHALTPNHKP
jgi:hypothetical protein